MDSTFLPSKDRSYLKSKQIKYREINNGAFKGLIIDDFNVSPVEKFTQEKSSLLIILPTGYPDVVPPDMFYFFPELKLKASGTFPAQADQFPIYFGQKWQQWSRHAPVSEWRAGKDGVHSYLQRVHTALNNAK